MQRDFINAAFMTTTFKIRLEECANDVQRFDSGDEISRQTEHIRIIMLTRQFCQFGIPAQRGTYALVLIGTHANTVTGGADDDSEFEFAFLHSLCQWMRKIRVVTTLGAITAEVFYFSAVVLQEQLYLLLERKTCVVACQRNRHFTKTFHISNDLTIEQINGFPPLLEYRRQVAEHQLT